MVEGEFETPLEGAIEFFIDMAIKNFIAIHNYGWGLMILAYLY
jgi:hypothetical protein